MTGVSVVAGGVAVMTSGVSVVAAFVRVTGVTVMRGDGRPVGGVSRVLVVLTGVVQRGGP